MDRISVPGVLVDIPWFILFPVYFVCMVVPAHHYCIADRSIKIPVCTIPHQQRIEKVYNQFFYKSKTLGELPSKPVLVIGSTNLQTARPFSFSKYWMQDSTYQFMDEPVKFKSADFPIARAVMASSCVPFAFTPIVIDEKYFEDPSKAAYYHPLLVDGGIYDNQGIHKVMQQGTYACDFVITSDAGCGSTGEMSFKTPYHY